MRPADQIKVMFVQEFGNNLCTKCERHTSVIFTPAHCILPSKIRHLWMNKMDLNLATSAPNVKDTSVIFTPAHCILPSKIRHLCMNKMDLKKIINRWTTNNN
jgi:PHP family Zn ribbon phosphoesterase